MIHPLSKPDRPMGYTKLFITSLPRSGSTVLTTLLDRHEDILCLPESFFPVVIGEIEDAEWADTRRMAALFVASCSDGSPLELAEAESCIREDKNATLDGLAAAVAVKSGRDPESIRIVVWKFTRLVGCWRFAATTGGSFLILHRNPLNVFESQFRVPFGEKNRNPCRFALFEASYAAAFKEYPRERTRHLDYPDIGIAVEGLAREIGSRGELRDGGGGVGTHSGDKPWHAGINRPFENQDSAKLAGLKRWQIIAFHGTKFIFACMPILPRIARNLADRRQLTALRRQAELLLQQPSKTRP